jgi:hypothetical protein
MLSKEWTDFSLVAAVLLSSTVGFLALGNLGPIAQGACILSSLFSAASMMIGVFLVWRHRVHMNYPDIAFFYQWNARSMGLIIIAVLLSLPMIFLILSVTAFLVSIVAYSSSGFDTLLHPDKSSPPFDNLSATAPLPAAISYLITVCAFIITISILTAILVFWKIWDRGIYFQTHTQMGWRKPLPVKKSRINQLREWLALKRSWFETKDTDLEGRAMSETIRSTEKV